MNAYILAGGESTRFGHCKARVEIDGKPSLVRLCDQLESCGLSPWVVSKRREDFADLFSDPTPLPRVGRLADQNQRSGPLAGIGAALEHCIAEGHPKCWILTCDLIRWQPAWKDWGDLLPAPTLHDPLAVLLATQSEDARPNARSLQPFPGLYDVRTLGFLTEPSVMAKQSVFSWLAFFEHKICQIPVPKPLAPQTFNTPEELHGWLTDHR